MAVTLTVADMLTELRYEPTDEAHAILADPIRRALGAATAIIEQHAPGAPEAVQNEAAVLLVGYLHDRRREADYTARANVFLNSGASAVLAPWRVPAGTST